jgi:hypothetical protein
MASTLPINTLIREIDGKITLRWHRMVENCALVHGTLAAWSKAVPTLQIQYWYSMPGMAMPSHCRLPLYDFCPWCARQPSQSNIVCFARIVALPVKLRQKGSITRASVYNCCSPFYSSWVEQSSMSFLLPHFALNARGPA